MPQKILVGIDDFEQSRRVLGLTMALKFRDPKLELVKVIERAAPVGFGGQGIEQSDLIDRFLQLQEAEAQQLLDIAARGLHEWNVTYDSKVLTGFSPSAVLIKEAEQSTAALIAIGCHGKSKFAGIMTGSVGRSLAISSPKSILISKNAVTPGKPLTAVLATDHSQYAQRCLDTLLKLGPSGLERMVVLTVYPKNLVTALHGVMENFSVDLSTWVEDKLHQENSKAIETLKPLGCSFVSRVIDGDVNQSIAETVRDQQADLLILGAHGHGFFERQFLGSVALHQTVAEEHSVMILRDA